jgi:colanic acid/amylovoran biosynthesis protein
MNETASLQDRELDRQSPTTPTPPDSAADHPPVAGLRILITDNVVGNMGDAAIVLGMKQSLEEVFAPNTEVRNCFCGVTADPGAYKTYYPELNFTRTLWNAAYDGWVPKWHLLKRLVRKTAAARFVLQARLAAKGFPRVLLWSGERSLFREFEEADVIVVTGGACLSTSWTQPRMRPQRIAEYETALTLGKPLIFYAQSFGPYEAGDQLPRLLKPVLERAGAVICRDADSYSVVRNVIGVRTSNVHQTIDEAILIPIRPPSRELAPAKQAPIRIGICVHQWHWLGDSDPTARQSEFEQRIAQVCSSLLERGDSEIVFLTSHQAMEGAPHNDEEVSQRIYALLPEIIQPRSHVVSGFVHPSEFAYFMGQCDLVLSSRLHGGILSLAGGAPILALEYEPKTRGFMRQLGLEDWVLSMWGSSAEEILAQLTAMLSDLSATKRRCEEATAAARHLALRNREIVKEVVTTHKGKV